MKESFIAVVKKIKDVTLGDRVLFTDETIAEVTEISVIPHQSGRYFGAKLDEEHYREYFRLDNAWAVVIKLPVTELETEEDWEKISDWERISDPE